MRKQEKKVLSSTWNAVQMQRDASFALYRWGAWDKFDQCAKCHHRFVPSLKGQLWHTCYVDTISTYIQEYRNTGLQKLRALGYNSILVNLYVSVNSSNDIRNDIHDVSAFVCSLQCRIAPQQTRQRIFITAMSYTFFFFFAHHLYKLMHRNALFTSVA